MATIQAIKQLEERSVASEITLMVWSDRMDLVALANIKGEVALHRLTWTKAWSLAAPIEGQRVQGITWRPDGKIIAIAYSAGYVTLVEVENKNVLHVIEDLSDISCINWIQEKVPSSQHEKTRQQYMSTIDLSSNFLPRPLLDTTLDDGEKINLLQDQNTLNLLLIGTNSGVVHGKIFGCFSTVEIILRQYLNCQCCIENVHLTEGLNRMFVTVRDPDNNVKILLFDCTIFKTHANELFAVALKHIKLTSLLRHLSDTITTITESWEGILLEMDNKLSKYASKVPPGGITADFLEFLTFGICSDEMKEFLIQDLTKKGLEKFGQTIEMSYSNIQKLVLKHILRFGQNITYHLAEMRGMARLEHRYKILGLREGPLNDAILSNGAFLIKGGEMQQIINHSIGNYKAFFRWLYTAIMQAMEEKIPNEISKMTQQDLHYITEFLENFDHIGNNSTQSGFRMERLGQYLHDGPLNIQPNMSMNEWSCFLAQNQCVLEHETIFKHYKQMSLIQQFKHLKNTVDDIFTTPNECISQQFKFLQNFNCFSCADEVLKVSQLNVNQETLLFTFIKPPESIYALHINVTDDNCTVKSANLHFSVGESPDTNYFVTDIKLYSCTVLSVLLQENATKCTFLCQIPLTGAIEKFGINTGAELFTDTVQIDASVLTPKVFKCVEGIVGSQFAVSGSRKVGIVLAENKRKVRLYEMEADEEEDDDADMSVISQRE